MKNEHSKSEQRRHTVQKQADIARKLPAAQSTDNGVQPDLSKGAQNPTKSSDSGDREQVIAPRVDDDGVPWCDARCPQAINDQPLCGYDCAIGEDWWKFSGTAPCPHAVRRMALENEAWRSERLSGATIDHGDHLRNAYRLSSGEIDVMYYDTIDAAVDALIVELEE